MPTAVPAGATASLPPARKIDPRGHRFGAAVSSALLIVSFLLNAPIGVALALLSIGVSAAFGLRYSIYGIVWRRIVKALHLGPAEPEHEYPPRFAQALGATFIGIGSLLLLAGISPWGWLPVIGVIALQVLLAVTGYCLGCRLYFVRWYLPALFTRLIARRSAP